MRVPKLKFVKHSSLTSRFSATMFYIQMLSHGINYSRCYTKYTRVAFLSVRSLPNYDVSRFRDSSALMNHGTGRKLILFEYDKQSESEFEHLNYEHTHTHHSLNKY